METAFMKAIALLLSADAELMHILRVTAEMSLQSSTIALLLGVPLGILLGQDVFAACHHTTPFILFILFTLAKYNISRFRCQAKSGIF